MTRRFKTLTELDEEAFRLRSAGEMTYETFKALFFNGVALGFGDDDLDVLIGACGVEHYLRLVREQAKEAPPEQQGAK